MSEPQLILQLDAGGIFLAIVVAILMAVVIATWRL